eukprot:817428-Pleurochrysis_carterae.AAC.1
MAAAAEAAAMLSAHSCNTMRSAIAFSRAVLAAAQACLLQAVMATAAAMHKTLSFNTMHSVLSLNHA